MEIPLIERIVEEAEYRFLLDFIQHVNAAVTGDL